MAQVMNSYLYGSFWNSTPYIIGAPFKDIAPYQTGGNATSFIPANTADIEAMIQNQTYAFTVPAVQTTQSQVYFCFFPWLSVFLVANIVTMLAAIVGIYFPGRRLSRTIWAMCRVWQKRVGIFGCPMWVSIWMGWIRRGWRRM